MGVVEKVSRLFVSIHYLRFMRISQIKEIEGEPASAPYPYARLQTGVGPQRRWRGVRIKLLHQICHPFLPIAQKNKVA